MVDSDMENIVMEVDLLLADYAADQNGKLTLVGAGWSVTTTPANIGLGILFRVPWDLANTPFKFIIKLLDDDGNAVVFPRPDGSTAPVQIEGDFEVGRPPGLPRGSVLTQVGAINFNNLSLEPGRSWEIRLEVSGGTVATRPFRTAPADR